MGGKRKELTGERFGRLTVVEPVCSTKHGWTWKCKCDCGNEIVVISSNLKKYKSCGCQGREQSSERLTTHGKSKSRLFPVWQSLKQRCENPSNHAYAKYGGRGIKVCKEWSADFVSFEQWAYANGYDENAKRGECTIDRIDVNGNYEPSNCRWITSREQQSNKRNNVHLTYQNETLTVAEWAKRTGLTHSTISGRLKRGWSAEKILLTPKKRYV